MRIGLIGPLVLEGSKGTVAIPAAKHRVMLAMLALRAGRVVSFEELAEAASRACREPGRAARPPELPDFSHDVRRHAAGKALYDLL